MKRPYGYTIAEVLIASFIMSLLTGICFAIYAIGLRSWTKMDGKTAVMANLQVINAKIAREVLTTQQPSISIPLDSSGLSFLSAGPENSRMVDPGGRPIWQEFVYYYFVPSDGILYRRTDPYTTADNTLLSKLDIFLADTLVNLKVGGQPEARDLMKFEARIQNPDILNLVVRAQSGKEEFEISSCYQLAP